MKFRNTLRHGGWSAHAQGGWSQVGTVTTQIETRHFLLVISRHALQILPPCFVCFPVTTTSTSTIHGVVHHTGKEMMIVVFQSGGLENEFGSGR